VPVSADEAVEQKDFERTVYTFIVPEVGDKVGSGIGLSFRPASLCCLADRYDNRS
jgi:hypothetical protein